MNGHLSGLTYDHGIWAVPLGVLLALPHAADAGLCLVGAQGLPLTLQTVLVLQVVLHVWLEENRQHLSRHFKRQARTVQRPAEFISKHGCKNSFCVCFSSKFGLIKRETWNLAWDSFTVSSPINKLEQNSKPLTTASLHWSHDQVSWSIIVLSCCIA